jgi:hypothetical protein
MKTKTLSIKAKGIKKDAEKENKLYAATSA